MTRIRIEGTRSGTSEDDPGHRDVVVVGSGFGGVLAAWPLVRAGLDVLMVERGPWVSRGPHNWAPEGTLTRTRYYDDDRYRVNTGGAGRGAGACSCVGGPSVFYGGVSLRFREEDFRPDPEIVGDSGAAWPFGYDAMEPFYARAERILGVAGRAGEDPTEPPRSCDYPVSPDELSHVSSVMAEAAETLGLRPFRLPLAIHYGEGPAMAGANVEEGAGNAEERAGNAEESSGNVKEDAGNVEEGTGNVEHGGRRRSPGAGKRRACARCGTCDTFACAVGAKNDLASRVIPALLRRGMELWSETAVTRLEVENGRIEGVECVEVDGGARHRVRADTVILAAGALASPRILLASGLEEKNPAGDAVGRYLTRHCSGIVFGAYLWIPRYEGRFHKQIGVHDFYLGAPDGEGPPGKLGNIQQTQTPNMGTVEAETRALEAFLLRPLVRRATGLLVIAEDRPRYENRLRIDPDEADELGMPRPVLEHRYHPRDLAARQALARQARRIHRAAGSPATYHHEIDTFSHALGTVRMGEDPRTSPLAPDGHFRGVENLYVTDGSALPTAGGVNPSLTIAANALRIGAGIAGRAREGASRSGKGSGREKGRR